MMLYQKPVTHVVDYHMKKRGRDATKSQGGCPPAKSQKAEACQNEAPQDDNVTEELREMILILLNKRAPGATC